MFEHPITARHLHVLGKEWGVGEGGSASSVGASTGWFEIIKTTSKVLACGDVGGEMRVGYLPCLFFPKLWDGPD